MSFGRMFSRVRAVGAGVLVATALAMVPAVAQTSEPAAPPRAEGPYPGSPASFADLSEKLLDSVVNISTSQNVARSESIPMPDLPPDSQFEEFFEEFFNRRGDDDG